MLFFVTNLQVYKLFADVGLINWHCSLIIYMLSWTDSLIWTFDIKDSRADCYKTLRKLTGEIRHNWVWRNDICSF